MNRFSQDEIKEFPLKLANILQTTDNPTDVADQNYINFLKHLMSLARTDGLISFDPVKDSASNILNRILSKTPLKNNNHQVFNH